METETHLFKAALYISDDLGVPANKDAQLVWIRLAAQIAFERSIFHQLLYTTCVALPRLIFVHPGYRGKIGESSTPVIESFEFRAETQIPGVPRSVEHIVFSTHSTPVGTTDHGNVRRQTGSSGDEEEIMTAIDLGECEPANRFGAHPDPIPFLENEESRCQLTRSNQGDEKLNVFVLPA